MILHDFKTFVETLHMLRLYTKIHTFNQQRPIFTKDVTYVADRDQ